MRVALKQLLAYHAILPVISAIASTSVGLTSSWLASGFVPSPEHFNAANRWALPVVLDSLNKDAVLNVHSQPATETQSTTLTPTKSSSAAWNELPSPMWMALMAVSTLIFTS